MGYVVMQVIFLHFEDGHLEEVAVEEFLAGDAGRCVHQQYNITIAIREK
jgi:hypothetical protein